MAIPFRILAAFCLFCGLTTARSAETETPPELSVSPAMEYRFGTRPGAVYELQGSSDGMTWAPVAGPFFGDGQPRSGFLRGAAGARLPHYRVRELDPLSVGMAPVGLAGQTLVFNEEGNIKQFIFLTEGRGILKTDPRHARTFTATVVRTAADRLKVNLIYRDNTGAVLELEFQESRLGTARWTQNAADGSVEFTEAGGFSLHTGRLRQDTGTAALPAALTGGSMLFTEAGQAARLEFTSPNEVTLRRPDRDPVVFPYTYELETLTSGTLQLEQPGGTAVEYQLNLSSPAAGSFTKMEAPAGGAPAPSSPSSRGDFTMPAEPAPPSSPNCPPPNLKDRSFYLAGSDPVILTFNGAGAGAALRQRGGSVEVTPFTYDYSRSGNGASLSLTYPGAQNDVIEDYDMQFNEDCGGSYERSEFEDGELTNSDGGNFDQGLASGRAARSKISLSLAW